MKVFVLSILFWLYNDKRHWQKNFHEEYHSSLVLRAIIWTRYHVKTRYYFRLHLRLLQFTLMYWNEINSFQSCNIFVDSDNSWYKQIMAESKKKKEHKDCQFLWIEEKKIKLRTLNVFSAFSHNLNVIHSVYFSRIKETGSKKH